MQDDPRLVEALKRADQAGNVEDAKRLAAAISAARQSNRAEEKPFWSDFRRSENVSHQQPRQKTTRLDAVNAGAFDMATFGAGDEIMGAVVGAPVGAVKGAVNAVREGDLGAIPRGIADEYAFIRDSQRQTLGNARQDRPVSAAVGSVVGVAANPLSQAGGTFAAGATTKAGAISRGALVGGAEGGLYGAGSGEDLGERGSEALTGVGIGAVGGAGATWLLGSVGNLFTKNASKMTRVQKQAAQWLRDAAVKDAGGDKNAANGMLRVWAKKQNMNPEWLVKNAGPNVRMLIEEASQDNPTPGLQLIEKMRRANADAVYDGATRAMNPSGDSVKATRDALRAARQAQSQPLYEQAYQTELPPEVYDSTIGPLLTNSAAKRAIKSGMRLVDAQFDDPTLNMLRSALRDPSPPRAGYGQPASTARKRMSTKAVHQILKGFDDQISSAYAGGHRQLGNALTAQRNEISNALKQANPAFAGAQDVWAGATKMDEALDLGKKFIRPNYTVSDLATDLEGMTKGERDMYRVGLAEQLRNRVGNKPVEGNPARWMDNDTFQEKLRLLFADDLAEAEAFIRVVTDVDDMAGRLYDIDPTANSRTARRTAMREEATTRTRRAAGPAGAAEALVQNPISAIPRAVTGRVAGGARERAAAEMRETLRSAFFRRADDMMVGAAPVDQFSPAFQQGGLAAPVAQIPYRQRNE